MSAGHTPGPWMRNPAAPLEIGMRRDDRTIWPPLIARVTATGDNPTGEANARLIAAAPDFMDGAPIAVEILEHYAEFIADIPSAELERHPYLPEIERVTAILRAAIAKATGQ